ncbi:MAG: hypothetical protein ACXWWL_03805 [Candidatus Limnocylindria bacterium]
MEDPDIRMATGSAFVRERRRRALSLIAARFRSGPDDVAPMRRRWESVAAARRRGVELPPIDVYRIGELHFVQDRHDRVSVARALGGIELSDEWRYAQLATLVEAWGFRASHHRRQLLSREETAELWFQEEYEPVTAVLRDAGAGGAGTETERYMRVAMLRFLLLHTHDWTDDIVERLLGEVRPPSADDDTMVHQILKEML